MTESPNRRADDSISTGELGRRLERLESHVSDGFRELNATIIATSSTYLRIDLYLSERDAQKEELEATRRIAMWALGTICSVTLGAIVLGIISLSGAFGTGP